jgi:hypothetical protein
VERRLGLRVVNDRDVFGEVLGDRHRPLPPL